MNKNFSDKKTASFSGKLNDYFLQVIEHSKDILYLIDAKTGKFKYVSPAVAAISGFTPQEIIEMGIKGINERTHPDDLRTVKNKITDVLANKIMPSNFYGYIEMRFKHKAGHYTWFGINRNFLADDEGRIKAVIGSVRDITETKLLQQQLETAMDNYKTLYNNARVALFRTRISDGKMLECNEFMAKLIGFKDKRQCLAECYTTNYAELDSRNDLIKLLKEKGQVDNFEMKTRRVNGETLWIRISARIYSDKGYLEGALWDITTSKILTPAENEILDLIMQGKCNKEIAFHLKRSTRTIEDHRANMMRKLKVHNLVELVQKAIESRVRPAKK